MTHHARRRAAFAAAVGDAVAIVPAAVETARNADNAHPFRQDSDFFYLTGFEEPDAVLVLRGGAEPKATLFVRPRDRAAEMWTGPRAGVEGALERCGVDEARPLAELEARLPELLVGFETLYYELGDRERFDRVVLAAVRAAREKTRRVGVAPRTFASPASALHELRVRKDADELDAMRRAAAATEAGFLAGMRATRPGMYEYELAAEIEFRYRLAGARDVAYPSIVAGGANACVLHYHANRARLDANDLVLVDSGAEYDLYACDVTRTWPVGGRLTSEAGAIYDVVLRAQLAAIDAVRAGASLDAYHDAATRTIAEGLVDLGILAGPAETAIESGAIREYYPHRTGHFLGLDVHDAGRTRDAAGVARAFEPGMVVTVEPGIYLRSDSGCPPRFAGIGIRIEDDVLCTEGEPEILTRAVPKSASDLEAIVGTAPGGR